MAKTDLEKIKAWLDTYPGHEILREYHVDYTDRLPGNGGVFPTGITEISRTEDIVGNVAVTEQLNFALYYVFAKSPGDDTGAAVNADWVADFQNWAAEQSIRHKAPIFGDEPDRERIRAENGMLYQADEEGTAVYAVQLSVQRIRQYDV